MHSLAMSLFLCNQLFKMQQIDVFTVFNPTQFLDGRTSRLVYIIIFLPSRHNNLYHTSFHMLYHGSTTDSGSLEL